MLNSRSDSPVQSSLPYQIGQPLEKEGKWYINPDLIRCGTCPLFRERGAISIEEVSTRVYKVENEVEMTQSSVEETGRRIQGLQRTVDAILNGLNDTPDYNIRTRHKCSSCGPTGLIAVRTVCTSCGANDSWVFHPEKK